MKPGLSLRMSQHLALTPQLQQSIRLLQLSTLELSQEVDQMLDENPFLERAEEEAASEAFGLDQADTHVSLGDRVSESASTTSSSDDSASETRDEAVTDVAESWDGDGSVDMRPDDSEWGGDAAPRQNNGEETADAIDLARSSGSLTDFLHRQALSLRLSEVDRAALRFLIESLNDDGYLTDTLPELAATITSKSTNWCTASPWRWVCCSRSNPWAWAHATWPSACASRSKPGCRTTQMTKWPKRRWPSAPSRWRCWPSATSNGWRWPVA